MMHLGVHNVVSVRVSGLKDHDCFTMKITDDDNHVITIFLEPNQLDIFTDAVAAFRSPVSLEVPA